MLAYTKEELFRSELELGGDGIALAGCIGGVGRPWCCIGGIALSGARMGEGEGGGDSESSLEACLCSKVYF